MNDMPASGTPVCRLEDIDDPGSKGVTVSLSGRMQDIFIVRQGDRVFGYLNRCPHTGAPLDWTPDRFLDLDGEHIQCAMHAALFRIDDGRCIAGPCSGDRLTPVALKLEAGVVRLAVPATGECARSDAPC
jgi:nitrite reductase/ring-hydroxylating ferredoxin subunit